MGTMKNYEKLGGILRCENKHLIKTPKTTHSHVWACVYTFAKKWEIQYNYDLTNWNISPFRVGKSPYFYNDCSPAISISIHLDKYTRQITFTGSNVENSGKTVNFSGAHGFPRWLGLLRTLEAFARHALISACISGHVFGRPSRSHPSRWIAVCYCCRPIKNVVACSTRYVKSRKKF